MEEAVIKVPPDLFVNNYLFKIISMDCLHCGDCCLRMSPINHGRCPFLLEVTLHGQNYVFCGEYKNRPKQCSNHSFDSRFCPVGIDVLKPKNLDILRQRIDIGYEYCKNIGK